MKQLKELSSKPRLAKILIVLLMLGVGAAIASPFFLSHIEVVSGRKVVRLVNTHDLIQHLAVMNDFDKVLRSGNLYPRWLPDYNRGYGGPWMDFYPPGFYYIASVTNLALGDWVSTLFVISVLGFAASGMAFYWLSREFYSRAASVFAALLYMVLPYHVINLYWQGAMPQLLGFIFLPLVLYFAYRVGARGRARDYAGLGLAYGLYLLTHAPVSFLMTYALAFLALLWAYREKNLKIAIRIGIGMGIGLLVGAIYWLPAAIESRHIHEFFSLVFPYHASYLTLMPSQGFGQHVNQSFVFQTVIIIVAAIILRSAVKPDRAFMSTAPSSQRKDNEPETSRSITGLWVILAIVTTFMNTSFSIYVSKLLPKIQVATFPWRWLAISSLFTSLLAGAAIDRLRARAEFAPVRLWAYRAALAAAIAVNIWYSLGSVIPEALSNGPMESRANYVDPGFTPIGGTYPQELPDTPPVVIDPKNAANEIVRWDPDHREVYVRVDEPSTVRLKTYNFPGWTAAVDGQTVPLESDKDGIQLISVPPGRHKVETRFGSTAPRTLGSIFFFLGLAAIGGLTITDIRGKRIRKIEKAATLSIEGEKSAGEKSTLVVVAALVLAGIFIAVFVMARQLASGDGSPSAGSTALNTGAGGFNEVGSEARLSVGDLKSIPVSVDEKALDELMSTIGNTERVDELVRSGRLYRVDNNTRVRILALGPGKTKVRILEGDSLTLEGWVPERWIR